MSTLPPTYIVEKIGFLLIKADNDEGQFQKIRFEIFQIFG